MIDCHIHSEFSHDSDTKIEEILKAVDEKGIEGFIITDHWDFIEGEYFKDFKINDFEHYKRTMKSLGIPVGLELGWDGEQEIEIDLSGVEFIILSVHKWQIIEKPELGDYDKYLEILLKCVKNPPKYSVLGHFDFPRRYHSLNLPFSEEFDPIIKEILKTVIEDGKGIELNTAPLGHYGETNPDIRILKMYRELKGEIITIGSDAHNANQIGRGFSQAKDILLNTGFKYFSRFYGGNISFEKIR